MSQTSILDSLEFDKKLKGRLKVDTKFNMAQIIFMQGRRKDVQLVRLAITEECCCVPTAVCYKQHFDMSKEWVNSLLHAASTQQTTGAYTFGIVPQIL